MGFVIENDVLIEYIPTENETEVVIPDGIKKIDFEAFEHCYNIKSVIIPDTVEIIERNAFWGCTSLENITIPESVKDIGSSAFIETEWQRNQFKKSPFVIVNDILVKVNENLKGDVKIPDGIRVITECAFFDCHYIKSVEFPASVKIIKEHAFNWCIGMEKIIIPDTVEEIGKDFVYGGFFARNIIIKGEYINIRVFSKFEHLHETNFSGFLSTEDRRKENYFNKIDVNDYKIPSALVLFCKYNSKVAEEYIKNHIIEVVNYIISKSDARCLTRVLHFIGAGEIDELIKRAIEYEQIEMQVILSNYKNDNFGFDTDFEKYKL